MLKIIRDTVMRSGLNPNNPATKPIGKLFNNKRQSQNNPFFQIDMARKILVGDKGIIQNQ